MTNHLIVEPFVNAALGKKARDLVVLDVQGLTTIADYFIICSGRSNRQVSAIDEHIRTEMKKMGKKLLSIEGEQKGLWVLMDFGDIIIHIFYEATRKFYDLEGLWMDAKRITTESMKHIPEPDVPEEDVFDDNWVDDA